MLNFCLLIYFGLLMAFVKSNPENVSSNNLETSDKTANKIPPEPSTFNLYTRENPYGEEQLLINNTEILYASHFNESRLTKFIIHGFSDIGNEAWIRDLVDAYLKYENVNVIVVCWGVYSVADYTVAANNTQKVGEYLGEFLLFLNRESNFEYNDAHISAHSLGSHVAGFTGRLLEGQIGRITGLDPAGPLYETTSGLIDPDLRLDPTDAQFVDVIHTSAPAFGLLAPIGHADFYPNNGIFPQPGCSFLPTTTYCSHSRAHQFMTESIGSATGFKARTCNNWEKYREGKCDHHPVVLMGEYAATSLRGKFYLSTHEAAPFAIEK